MILLQNGKPLLAKPWLKPTRQWLKPTSGNNLLQMHPLTFIQHWQAKKRVLEIFTEKEKTSIELMTHDSSRPDRSEVKKAAQITLKKPTESLVHYRPVIFLF
jgi:hypothetical protein